jgi:hypothetical protein
LALSGLGAFVIVANLRVELRQALVNERRMASGDVIPLSQRRQSH